MKKHTKLYYSFFGYDFSDIIISEITGQVAVDINHIEARGMGGRKSADNIDNLMAVTREEHLYFGDKKIFKEWLRLVHKSFIETRLPWIETNPDCEILKQYLDGTCSTAFGNP